MEGAQYLHRADTNVNVCTSLQVEYVCSFLVGCLVTSAWKQHTFAVLHLMRRCSVISGPHVYLDETFG